MLVQKRAGCDLVEYLTPRLFAPLNIKPPDLGSRSLGQYVRLERAHAHPFRTAPFRHASAAKGEVGGETAHRRGLAPRMHPPAVGGRHTDISSGWGRETPSVRTARTGSFPSSSPKRMPLLPSFPKAAPCAAHLPRRLRYPLAAALMKSCEKDGARPSFFFPISTFVKKVNVSNFLQFDLRQHGALCDIIKKKGGSHVFSLRSFGFRSWREQRLYRRRRRHYHRARLHHSHLPQGEGAEQEDAYRAPPSVSCAAIRARGLPSTTSRRSR